LLIVVWLGIQVAVPAYALTQPRPARLGWQMYTGISELPSVTVELDDGSRQAVDVASLIARDRAEADYMPALRATLCGRSGVATVTILLEQQREVTRCQ
jgi:hypothetical protein